MRKLRHAGVDDIELEECNDCDLVKNCSDKCREEHRKQHKKDCKNFCLRNLIAAISETWNAERAAEIRDEILFRQPESSHLGECLICFLPLSLDQGKSTIHTCCSKIICNGCVYAQDLYANYTSNIHDNDRVKAFRCPFCREPVTADDEQYSIRQMERIKASDPAALSHMGGKCYDEGDYDGALEYLTKAAELRDVNAHFLLGMMYKNGRGMKKDKEKAVHHYEKAAIGGHPTARNNLGYYEEENGNIERAVKHYIIAANLGNEVSMKTLWAMFKDGDITKEDLETTLRTHKTAIDAMKSSQRDAAERAFRA